jgi:hypothetical protein
MFLLNNDVDFRGRHSPDTTGRYGATFFERKKATIPKRDHGLAVPPSFIRQKKPYTLKQDNGLLRCYLIDTELKGRFKCCFYRNLSPSGFLSA